jgi:hypothetical protein
MFGRHANGPPRPESSFCKTARLSPRAPFPGAVAYLGVAGAAGVLAAAVSPSKGSFTVAGSCPEWTWIPMPESEKYVLLPLVLY